MVVGTTWAVLGGLLRPLAGPTCVEQSRRVEGSHPTPSPACVLFKVCSPYPSPLVVASATVLAMETPSAADAVRRAAEQLNEVAERARRIASAADALAGMAELAWQRRDNETLAAMCTASARLTLAARDYFKIELTAVADAARGGKQDW